MTRAVRISTPVIWLKPWDHLAHHCGQPRLPLYVGYSITSVDGSVPQFNILHPSARCDTSTSSRWNLSVDIDHKWAFNMGWNYYQYAEASFVGPTASRYFHADSLTESLRYSF